MNKTRLNNTTKLIIGGLLSISIVAGSFTAVNAYNDDIANKADATPIAKIKTEKLVVTEESKKPVEIKKETPKEVPAINARVEKKIIAKSEDDKVADEKRRRECGEKLVTWAKRVKPNNLVKELYEKIKNWDSLPQEEKELLTKNRINAEDPPHVSQSRYITMVNRQYKQVLDTDACFTKLRNKTNS